MAVLEQRLKRIPIHVKVSAALAAPLVLLFVATLLEVVEPYRDAREVRDQADLARSAIGPSGLITAIQDERMWAYVDLLGLTQVVQPAVQGYDRSRAATDRTRRALRHELTRRGGAAVGSFAPALRGLDGLARLRADIDTARRSSAPTDPDRLGFTDEAFNRYSTLIDGLLDATTDVSNDVNDVELRKGVELADAVTRHLETLTVMTTRTITMLTHGGIDRPSETTEVSALLAEFERSAETILTATGTYRHVADRWFPFGIERDVDRFMDDALKNRPVDFNMMIDDINTEPSHAYPGYRQAIHTLIGRRAGTLDADAGARMRWFTALAVITLASTAWLTWRVSRSITGPLRSLTIQGRTLARRRLPEYVRGVLDTPLGQDVRMPTVEPVRVETRDEVANVAAALNTVQSSAVGLAVEQAMLRRNIADVFVNLGRRNQNLLVRQLDFITELEHNETDPDTLTNLFGLDHLATRMRRNAESLLVLAGIDPPRKWAGPIRISDAIRAALGEVEGYQRVTIHALDPATVMGSAAADLAHLLAELIENALMFSPPDHVVGIHGRAHPAGYALAIVDSGLGMPPDELARANRRLAGAESFTIAPSKYLGHYVAGSLAARHDIAVRLQSSPGKGITATVDLPPTLLADALSLDRPSQALRRSG